MGRAICPTSDKVETHTGLLFPWRLLFVPAMDNRAAEGRLRLKPQSDMVQTR